MSTIDFVVDQVANRTGGDPKVIRRLLSRGIGHISDGVQVNQDSMVSALEATRNELSDPEDLRIIGHVEDELRSMGMLKQMLVFSTINAGIADLRRELAGQ